MVLQFRSKGFASGTRAVTLKQTAVVWVAFRHFSLLGTPDSNVKD